MRKMYFSLILILSTIFASLSLTLSTAAYTTPSPVNREQALAKIEELINLLDGKYFTVNQKPCTSSRVDPHGCDNCSNSAIIKEPWFTEMFVSGLNTEQFPTHADYDEGVFNQGLHGGGRSCYGFATFAQWYIFSSKPTDDVEHKIIVQNVTCNYENIKKYALPGDTIRTSSGHSMIFISCDTNGYRVLDCNGWLSDPNCRIRSKTRTYSGKIAITRATNYDVSTPSEPVVTVNEKWIVDKGTTNLRIRSGPSTDYDQVGLVTFKDTVTVTKKQGNWGYITYNGVSGWISLDYCTKVTATSTPETTTKTQYRYYHYTNSNGRYSVCAYYGKSNYGGTWKREDTGWLDAPLKKVADNYVHTNVSSCAGAGCTDASWNGGKYEDSNGTPWYREETRTVTVEVAHTHTYNSGTVTKQPTCTSNGTKTYTCTVCSATKTETIAKLGHSYDSGTVTKQATCGENGTKVYTCTTCGTTKNETISKEGAHSYNSGVVTKEATCEKTGTVTYTCTVCSTTKTETIAKLGHNYTEVAPKIAPTCTTAGKTATLKCTNCNTTSGGTSISKLKHEYSTEYTIDKQPTCTEKGSKSYHCINCGAQGSAVTIAKTEHTYGDWEVTKAPQPGKSGSKQSVCVICGYKKTGTVPAITKKNNDKRIIMTIGCTDATVFGKEAKNDVPPIIVNNRTMLPARFVAENLGATVGWDGPTQKVTIKTDTTTIEMFIGKSEAYVNGIAVTLDSAPFIHGNRTYTPVRFIAENLGATVEWQGDYKQAIITKK